MRQTWWTGAITATALIVAACSDDPEVAKRRYLESGDRYANQEKYSEAVIQYRNAISQDPRFGEARVKLAQVHEKTGDLGGALAEYVRAADLLPEDVTTQLQAGKMLIAAGRFEEARTRAAAVLAKEPKNVNALIVMGNALAGLKDIDGAIKQIEGAIDAEPQLTFAYTNLGALEIRKGDREAAEAAFKRAVEVSPQSVDAHINLANFYWAMNRGAQAETEFKAALAIDPKSTAANKMLATLYMLNGRRKEAEPPLKAYAEATPDVAARLALADFYLQDKRTEDAVRVLDLLKGDKSGYAPATMRLAAIEFAADRKAKAYAIIDEVLKAEPKHEGTLETRGRFLLVDRRFADALAAFDAAVAVNPRGPRLLYLRGLALRNLGRNDEAIASLRQMLQVAPSSTAGQSLLAELYLANNEPGQAVPLLADVIRKEPRSGPAHFLYGQAQLLSGNIQAAEAQIVPLAKAYPRMPDMQVWLGRLYLAKGDTSRARQAFTKALELEPDSLMALNGLIAQDVVDKKYDAVRARLEPRVAERPKDTALLFLAANTYMAMADFGKAESLFQRVLELEPTNFEAYTRLGGIYLAQGRLEEARRKYEHAEHQKGNPVAAATLTGMVLEMQNKRDEARKQYERALSIDPRAVVAANNLAWLHAESGENLDVALQLAQTAKERSPKSAQVSDTLGWIYYKKGLAGLAVQTLREGVAQSPTNPVIHYHLGLAHLKNGANDEAKRALEQALKLKSEFAGAEDARRVLSTLQG